MHVRLCMLRDFTYGIQGLDGEEILEIRSVAKTMYLDSSGRAGLCSELLLYEESNSPSQ